MPTKDEKKTDKIEIRPELIEAGVDLLIEPGMTGDPMPVRGGIRLIVKDILSLCLSPANLPKTYVYLGEL
ncbi:hypothetical protein WNZ14_17050 [Hoeflea sp. AS60]|uniref:hypothetical protein n=1 Tax=Hoeflea sp. AS60 TaxID=3135780 RepID=UPI00316BE518